MAKMISPALSLASAKHTVRFGAARSGVAFAISALVFVYACSSSPPPDGTPEAPGLASQSFVIAPSPALDARVQVLTQHNDAQRTGANLVETALSPYSVRPDTFGQLFTIPVDGQIYAQPLYSGAASVKPGAGAIKTANVVYVATMNNKVYAFDADTAGAAYWSTTIGPPDTGFWPNVVPTGHGPGSFGIMSTPVIDPVSNTIFVVAKVSGQFVLARLDRITGALQSSVIIRSYPKPGPVFDAAKNLQRPALLLAQGRVYVGFGSLFEGIGDDYHGWLMAYDASFTSASAPLDSLCTTPSLFTDSNGNRSQNVGGGIWQAGNGIATDAAGRALFFQTGNAYQGTWVSPRPVLPAPAAVDLEDSFVRVPVVATPSPGNVFALAAKHPLTNPRNPTEFYDAELNDQDLGSAGPLLLPGGKLLGGGKTGVFYLLSTEPDSLGRVLVDQQPPLQAFWSSWDPSDNGTKVWAKQIDRGPHIHGSPVLWSRPSSGVSPIYAWSELDHLKRFDYAPSAGTVVATSMQSDLATLPDGNPLDGLGRMAGGVLSISANGELSGTGIVWAMHNDGNGVYGPTTGHLYAFDAEHLGAAIWEDRVPMYAKFTPPTVANGHVYVATLGNELRVYGLRTYDATKDVLSLPQAAPARVFCSGSGKQILTGDFNGDRRIDLLCHDTTNGAKTIAYAPSLGQPLNGDWSLAMGWCYASPGTPRPQLLVADFDGDGRSDLLCHDYTTGQDYLAYARIDGTFVSTTDYMPRVTWCTGTSVEVLTGDFDGNGRNDMLCHDRSNGSVWIRYAGGRQFAGYEEFDGFVSGTQTTYSDWNEPSYGWCFGASTVLEIGDFNADGRSDLLCHDASSGYKSIVFARDDWSMRFPGVGSGSAIRGVTDWQANMWWCMGGSPLSIADFNGDGADDIFCHNDQNGSMWIDYANPSRTSSQSVFAAPGTSSVTGTRGWCFSNSYTPGPVLALGDVDGDRRADVLCYDMPTTRTFVAYSPIAQ